MSAMRKQHQVAIALLLAAAVLAIGAVVRMWFDAPGVSVGLWGVEACGHGCRGIRWDDVHGADFDLVVAGYTATLASLVAAGLLVATAVNQLGGARGPVAKTRKVVIVALVAMAWFVIRLVLDNASLNVLAIGAPAAAIGALVNLRRL